MKVFARKATALKYVKPSQIICNDNIKKYFIQNDYHAFAELISSTQCPCYYEFIAEDCPLNLFIDIEMYQDKHPEEFDTHNNIIKDILDRLRETFTNFKLQTIVLSSHHATKRSYHVIMRAFASDSNQVYYFRGVKKFKKLINQLFPQWTKGDKQIIDLSVYREGLFRTYKSSKEKENRPLIKDDLSDDFDILDTFVCYCPDYSDEHVIEQEIDLSKRDKECLWPTETDIIEPIQKDLKSIDKECIKHFVRREYNYKEADFRDIFIDKKFNCIVIALDDRFCHNVDREHKSNNQYIVIDTFSCKKKCHDEDCVDYKYKEIKFDKLPKEINEIILKCLKVNKHDRKGDR